MSRAANDRHGSSTRFVTMDEAAFPILLVDLARREGALDADQLGRLWPVTRRAAEFVARNGPVTQQDRWEEDPGYPPFTTAVEIAAPARLGGLAVQPQVQGDSRREGPARRDAGTHRHSLEPRSLADGPRHPDPGHRPGRPYGRPSDGQTAAGGDAVLHLPLARRRPVGGLDFVVRIGD
jgi:hypothetical protein